MQSDRFHLIGAVFIILEKNGKVFLTRRQNTGWEDGKYSLAGGHLDGKETATQAAVREAQEELGITIDPNDVQLVNVSHLITTSERIHFTFVAKKWEGEPRNNEPEKADDGRWFDIDNLPENLMEVSKQTINWYRNNIVYTEFGWENK